MSLEIASCPASGSLCGVVTPGGLSGSGQGMVMTRTIAIPETNNNTIDKTALIIKINTPPAGPPVEPILAAGKGKRGPSGPIVTTSDEDESPDSPRDGEPKGEKLRTFSPPMLDHDYENINSPDNSSTASGPTYVRQPGFTHHAHEVTISKPKVKKKKTTLLCVKDGLRRREPTPPRNKPKRDPVPMRMRALPQSFWQQPNVPQNVSPAIAYPILPPLVNSRDEDQISDVRPITPPAEDKPERQKNNKPHRCGERKITVANTDLLFKLFEGVEKDSQKNHSNPEKEHVKNRSHRMRKAIPTTTNKILISGEDPYLVDGVTEKLFPELRLEQTKGSTGGPMSGTSLLHIVTLKEGDKSITLPSLSVEQNYSQMLSELVTHI